MMTSLQRRQRHQWR